MAYTDNPSTNTSDAIRLLVGDVSTAASAIFLSDKSYAYFYAQAGNVYGGAVLACNALAALNGGRAITKTVGDLSYTKGDANYYKQLATEYRLQAGLRAVPYAGGISRSDKQSVRQDTDRVAPNFAKELMDDPAAMDPQTGTSIQSSTVRY